MRREFPSQIKTLKSLPCVKQQRLVVGGPSITEPMEKSKGFQYALVSYHEDRAALAAYQASSEHERSVFPVFPVLYFCLISWGYMANYGIE